MNIDNYLQMERTRDFTCLEFADQIWLELTAKPLKAALMKFIQFKGRAPFKRISTPQSPCIVLLRGSANQAHTGIYVDGKLLHMDHQLPHYLPLHSVLPFYRSVKYYVNQ